MPKPEAVYKADHRPEQQTEAGDPLKADRSAAVKSLAEDPAPPVQHQAREPAVPKNGHQPLAPDPKGHHPRAEPDPKQPERADSALHLSAGHEDPGEERRAV